MKKICLVLGMCVFGLFSVYAQNTKGYENIQWGYSLNRLKEAYSNIQELLRSTANKDSYDYSRLESEDEELIGVRVFKQVVTQGPLQSRYFYFYKDQLYKIWEVYRSNNDVEKAIPGALIRTYGFPQGYSADTFSNGWDYLKWEFDDMTIHASYRHISERDGVQQPTIVEYHNPSSTNQIYLDVEKYKFHLLTGQKESNLNEVESPFEGTWVTDGIDTSHSDFVQYFFSEISYSKLMNIIENYNYGITMAVNADWGTFNYTKDRLIFYRNTSVTKGQYWDEPETISAAYIFVDSKLILTYESGERIILKQVPLKLVREVF